mgnify:CR=1 FL=1
MEAADGIDVLQLIDKKIPDLILLDLVMPQLSGDDLVRELKNSEKFNSIDILINNAGIWNYGAIDDMSLEHWKELIDINLTGTFLITKYVAQKMKLQKSGKIVTVTSTAGQRGEAFHSHYAASKGAQISFTKSLATAVSYTHLTLPTKVSV